MPTEKSPREQVKDLIIVLFLLGTPLLYFYAKDRGKQAGWQQTRSFIETDRLEQEISAKYGKASHEWPAAATDEYERRALWLRR